MGGYGSGPYSYLGKPSKMTAEACRSIDAAVWREGLRPDGPLVGWVCTWSDRHGQPVLKLALKRHRDRLELAYRHQSEDVRYHVPLVWTPCHYGGSRAWFICPGEGCGKRVRKLYQRGRYFLCRHCHRLTYSSCQESGNVFNRSCSRISDTKARLGAKGLNRAPAAPIPSRPKGMRFRTYWRLVDEIRREEARMWGVVAAKYGIS